MVHDTVYEWIDQIPLTRIRKSFARDFSDGCMVAEVRGDLDAFSMAVRQGASGRDICLLCAIRRLWSQLSEKARAIVGNDFVKKGGGVGSEAMFGAGMKRSVIGPCVDACAVAPFHATPFSL